MITSINIALVLLFLVCVTLGISHVRMSFVKTKTGVPLEIIVGGETPTKYTFDFKLYLVLTLVFVPLYLLYTYSVDTLIHRNSLLYSIVSLPTFLVVIALIVSTLLDIQYAIIPNYITLPLILVTWITNLGLLLTEYKIYGILGMTNSLIMAIVCLVAVMVHNNGLGGGDAKLIIAITAIILPQNQLLFSTVLLVSVVIYYSIRKLRNTSNDIRKDNYVRLAIHLMLATLVTVSYQFWQLFM